MEPTTPQIVLQPKMAFVMFLLNRILGFAESRTMPVYSPNIATEPMREGYIVISVNRPLPSGPKSRATIILCKMVQSCIAILLENNCIKLLFLRVYANLEKINAGDFWSYTTRRRR